MAVLPFAAEAQTATASGQNAGHTGFASGGSLDRPPLTKRWTVDLGSNVSYPVAADGRIFVSHSPSTYRSNSTVVALDAQTGQRLWFRPHPSIVRLAYDEGRLFALEADGTLLGLDAATGATLWTRQLREPFDDSEPVAGGGLVYVGLSWSGGALEAIDARDGSTRWTSSLYWADTPALDGRYVYGLEDYDCQVSAFERATGQRAWRSSHDCYSSDIPPVADGARTTMRSPGLILDSATGRVRDSAETSGGLAVAGRNGVARGSAGLYGRDMATGAGRWSFTGDGRLSTSPLIVNHTAYVGSSSGALFAVDVKTGQQLWSDPTAGSSGTAPGQAGMAAADGQLLVPVGGKLVAYGDGALTDRPELYLRVTSGPDGPTSSTTAAFGLAGAGAATAQCRLDGGAWAPCSSGVS